MLKFRRLFALLTVLIVEAPILFGICVEGSTARSEVQDEVSHESLTVILDNGSRIEVYVSDNCVDSVTAEDIQGIIEQHNLDSDCRITFYDMGGGQSTASANGYTTFDIFQPFPYYTYDTELTPLGDPYISKTDFIISVTKGQTVYLSKKYKGSVSLEIKTGTPYVEAMIGSGITCTYEKTQQFFGPPESSSYNSRSFYVRFYVQENKWVQRQYYWGMAIGTASGTAVIPTEYQTYSIDRYVS